MLPGKPGKESQQEIRLMKSKTKSTMHGFKIGDWVETTPKFETSAGGSPHIEGNIVGIQPIGGRVFDTIHFVDTENNTHTYDELVLRKRR